jgi:amino acid adenylation domain-containing protein
MFHVRAGEPVQVVAAPAPLNLPVTDLRELPLHEREAQLEEILKREAHEPFDLARGPLLRVGLVRQADEEHVLLVTMHHVVSDGWSLALFLRELATLYQAYTEGAESPLPKLPIQYADFASWQRNWLQDEKLGSLLDYWVNQLKGAPPVLELPNDHPRPPSRSYNGAKQSVMLPQSLTDELKRLSREQGITLFKVMLYRYSGQPDIVIGTPSANRNQAEIEELIGFFVNTLVLRTDLSGSPTFRTLLGKIRETVIDACTHQDLPFEKLVEELQPERDTSRTPLFQVMLIQQKQLMPELECAGVCFRPLEIDTTTAKFDLTLNFAEADQELRLTLEYSTDLFEAATARRMLGHLQTLLESAVANPEQDISELPLLTNDEQQQLLSEWNATARDYPAECVHSMFEKQVDLTPDSVAIVFGNDRQTYRELNARANQIAHLLQARGIDPESFVGIYIERTPEMVAGILGVLKAGGAYVPIDQTYPPERVKLILEDCGISALLTERSLLKNLPEHELPAICLDSDLEMLSSQSVENPVSDVQPDNLAYVIYTSGSTGKPKGVQISHGAVVNFLTSMQQAPGISAQDTLLSVTTLSFDIAGLEIYLPLLNGARVVLASRETALDGTELARLIESSQATVMQATPATWRLLLEAEWSGSKQLKLLCGGEALPGELAARLLQHGAALWNLYGPTETTIWSALKSVESVNRGVVEIGRPIANTQLYVLDQSLQPVPQGVAGELFIGGAGLARGYWRRPELTAEKFIPNPFGTTPGTRLYRTGDLARYLPDGDIEYLGRMDHQVKIRGFRIELGEIEAALAEQSIVRDVVVLMREDTPEDKRIVAYLVVDQESASPADELRRKLKEKLPSFMIPSTFIFLETMPLTPNGKIDRKALPAPDHTRPDIAEAFAAPRTPIEEMMATIWSQTLEIEKVGIHDNFFSLGGHSLLATQVVNRVRDTFNVDVPLRLFFETPTVADFANYVAQSQVGEADDATLSAALAELSQLSAEEREALLAMKELPAALPQK